MCDLSEKYKQIILQVLFIVLWFLWHNSQHFDHLSVSSSVDTNFHNKTEDSTVNLRLSIISRCVWGLWVRVYTHHSRYVSLKTWRPPAVVDKKIIKQKNWLWVLWSFPIYVSLLVFFLFFSRVRLEWKVLWEFVLRRYSESCVRILAANSAPALMACRSIFNVILFWGEMWKFMIFTVRIVISQVSQ